MIGDDILLDTLARRIRSPVQSPRELKVTRRAFLAGILVATSIPKAARAGPTVPAIRWTARGFSLRYQSYQWTLDRIAFGRIARLSIRQERGEIIVQVIRATLPGTDLRTDFRLTLFCEAGIWKCRLNIPSLGFSAQRGLGEWLSGRPMTGTTRSLTCTTACGNIGAAAGAMDVCCNPLLQFNLRASVALSGQVQAQGSGISLHLEHRERSIGSSLSSTSSEYFTAFELIDPVTRSKAFTCSSGAQSIAIRHHELESIEGEFIDTLTGRLQIALLRGRASLEVIREGAVEPLLLFDQAASLIAPDRIAVSGIITEEPFRVGLKNLAAEVQGRKDRREFKAVFHPGSTNDVAADLDVVAFLLPVTDGDHVKVVTGRQPGTLLGAGAKHQASGVPLLKMEGNDPSTISLEDSHVHLHRGADLLDLHFIFSGFELKQRWTGKSYLRRVRDGQVCVPATIILELPPQHLGEITVDYDGAGCPVPPQPYDTFLAQPSRVVFKLPRNDLRTAAWRTVPVSIASLTNWDDIEKHLSVAPRANAGDDLGSQLKAAGLENTQQDDLATILKRIESTLLMPRADETSLELADKLIFSPGCGTQWEFPGSPPDNGSPLFGIRIGHRSDPRLRALWSRRLDEQVIPTEIINDELVERAWGIVAQTSIYGLPALRRIAPKDGSDGVEGALANVPRGSVVRPDPPPSYLVEIDRLLEQHRPKLPGEAPPLRLPAETGIALATTFDLADVTMTSLGSTMRIDWRGEPPVFEPEARLKEAPRPVSPTALERLFYATWLERDELVISAEKGFLLPIGFRATLLKTQKRAYVPDPGRPGDTIAINITRTRIVTRQPTKSFPALNQPDAGRDWPVSRAMLRTDSTPTLADPESMADELTTIRAKHKLACWKVFWPRFHSDAANLADVEWKIQVEDDVTPMTTRMIFVQSELISVEEIVQDIVNAYNDYNVNDWPVSKTAKLNGARRRYADAKTPQDTSFDTDSWLLSARGRALGGKEYFIMDARMSGADQPPFYPSVRRTKVSVQSIDRLVGSPQGLIECQPDPVYVRNGFTGVNDPEIFLDVVRPEIAYNVTGVPTASMGVARPIALVAALSRLTGIVGGKRPDARPKLADSGTTELALEFDQARQNRFSAKEFLPEFKLLGINLVDLIKDELVASLADGPNLIEQFGYGANGADTVALDEIRSAAKSAADEVESAISGPCRPGATAPCNIDDAIQDLNHQLAQSNLSFETLYPDFAKAYSMAKDTVPASLRRIATAPDFVGVAKGASDTIVAAKPFIAAVEALVENPVPQVFEDVIKLVASTWQGLQGNVRILLQQFLNDAVTALVDTVVAPVFSSASADELELCFGMEVNPADIKQFLLDPSTRPQFEQAFLYNSLGAPLSRIADILSDLLRGLDGRVLLERNRLNASFYVIIAQAERVIHARLDPTVQGSVAQPAVQALLAGELLGAVDSVLQSLQPNPVSTDPLPKQLQELRSRIAAEVPDRLRSTLSAHPDRFPALNGDTATVIARDFVAAIGDKLAISTSDVVKAAADLTDQAVEQYATEIDRQVQRLAKLIVSLLINAMELGALPRLARAAATITDWCSGAQSAAAAGGALADGLLGKSSDIDQRLIQLLQNAALVSGPTSPPQATLAFEAARKDLLAATSDLMALQASLIKARQDVTDLQATNVCIQASKFARSVEKAMRVRNMALPILLRVFAAYDRMCSATLGAMSIPQTERLATQPTLADIEKLAKELLSDLTTVGRAGTASDWPAVATAINELKNNLTGFNDLLGQIDNEAQAIALKADEARKAIVAADSTQLVAIGQDLASDYIFADLRLAGLILQTIAFTDVSLARLEAVELTALQMCASGLGSFERGIVGVGKTIQQIIAANDVLRYLISLVGIEDFTSIQELSDEAALLDTISSAANADAAVAIVQPIIDKWNSGNIPLSHLFDQIAQLIDTFFQGNFSQLVAKAVRDLANKLKDELAGAVKQFVPTSITTSYDWKTKLADNLYFAIDSATSDDDGDHHLRLSSKATFDLVNKTSTMAMSGQLHSFKIMLPEMAVIHFGPAKFSGGSGQKTAFDVRVLSVELGNYLTFLEALSSWMSPSGNGIYVKPTFENIQVGYQLASDLIMVGDLEFINIAIDVYAKLPFGDGSAKFGFNFASEDRPFIIACAPYGGGGYLLMDMDAGGSLEDLTLSFLFGAVVAFQFSFLSGSGRIVAGFSFTERGSGENKGLTVQAIVEAVGEGQIACFSLTIFIRIVCTHGQDGNLDGSATYRFSFKVGFFSVHYSVTANRHIAGSHKAKAASGEKMLTSRESTSGPAIPQKCKKGQFTISTSTPIKNRAWKNYRNHVALDLIDDLW